MVVLTMLFSDSLNRLDRTARDMLVGLNQAAMTLSIDSFDKVLKRVAGKHFLLRQGSQSWTYPEYRGQVKEGYDQLTKMVKATVDIVSIRVSGDVGIVEYVRTNQGVCRYSDMSLHQVDRLAHYKDTWTLHGFSWKLSEMRRTSNSLSLDHQLAFSQEDAPDESFEKESPPQK